MDKLKKGDVRADGKIFWQYLPRLKSGQVWITADQYKRYTEIDNRPKSRSLKCGDERADGKVFWCYNSKSPNGEWWVTKEKHAEKMEKSRARDRARYEKRKSSPDWKKYHRERHKERIKVDESYRIAHNLRGNLSSQLKRFMQGKKVSAIRNLGCTLPFLKAYLEVRFKDGMTWQNYGSVWNIDHVVPMASFDLSQESHQLEACHYTNLQPMFVLENISKGCKQMKQMKLL
jgi:hypothetical protein